MALNNLGLGFLFTAKDLASGQVNRLNSNFGRLDRTTTEGTARVTAGFKQFGTGLAIFAAGVAGLAVLGRATALSDEFGAAIAEVSTLVDEASFPVDKMRELTKRLAAEFGGPITAQARGLYQAISAGATTAKAATETLTIANKLATAGMAELDDVVRALASVTKSYAAEGLTATEASDKLFTTVRLGITDVRQLSSTLAGVVPTAATAGVSFDEVAAALATLTGAGVPTAQAITQLNSAILALDAPTRRQISRAKELGIELGGDMLKTKGLAGAISDLASNTRLTNTDLRSLLGSQEALAAVQVLGRTQANKFNEAILEMGNAAGATDIALVKIQSSLKNTRARVGGLAEGIVESLGKALDPFRLAFYRIAESVLLAFKAIPEPVKNFIVRLLALASVGAIVVGGVIALKAAFALLAAGVAAGIVPALGVLLPIIGAVAAAIAVVSLAVAGFKIAWERDLGGIRTFAEGIFSKVKLAFTALNQLFTEGGFSKAVAEELGTAENKGVLKFVYFVQEAASRLKALFEGIAEGFAAAIVFAEPVFEVFKNVLSDLFDAFADILGVATDAGDAVPEDTFRKFGQVLGILTATVIPSIVMALTALAKVLDWTIIKPIQGAIWALRTLGVIEAPKPTATAAGPGMVMESMPAAAVAKFESYREKLQEAKQAGMSEEQVQRLERALRSQQKVMLSVDGRKLAESMREVAESEAALSFGPPLPEGVW